MAIYVRNQDGEMEPYKIVGLKGEDGITPNISIGTVTTLEAGEQATVTREGTNENPIFNFGIPKGESGANSSGSDSVAIDDSTISTDKTWSSSKIEDFVHTNDNTIWSTVQGENLSVDYTKEGYLREVEIWGNTVQNEQDLSNIQHLGVWNEEKQGYEIDIVSSNQMFVYEQNPKDASLEPDSLIITPISNGWNVKSKQNGMYQCAIVKLKNLIPNTAYRLKAKAKNYNNTQIDIYMSKGIQQLEFKNETTGDINLNKTFIPTQKEVDLYLYITKNTGNGNVDFADFILVKDKNVVEDLDMHKTTLLLPCQLMKVKNVADRLYWDSSKGKYVIEKYILATKLLSFRSKYGKFFQEPQIEGEFNLKNIDGSFIYGHGQVAQGFEYNGYNASAKTKGNLALSFYSDVLGRAYPHAEEDWTLKDVNNYIGEGKNLYAKLITPQLIETNITEQILLPCYKDKTHLFVNGEIDGSIKAKAPIDGGKAIQSLSAKNIALTLENEEMKVVNKEQDELINTTMLATDEMYSLLEPLFVDMLIDKDISPLLNMYVTMVKRGLKKIEQVPEKYREQVDNIVNNK